MSLELHVWGPAFGLPSIDPECLAAVAYLSLAAPRGSWSLVATSPSAILHALPALRDAQTGRWVATGFESLVDFVRARAAATTSSFTDVDSGLTSVQAADITAYAAFLRAEAAPLLALSLYVSSANWVATTRPAYSGILPFPLTWVEPPAVRTSYATSAAHLGFSSLDTDAEDDASSYSSSKESSALSAALHAFPDRIRKSVRQQQQKESSGPAAKALTPEAKAQIRLDEAARACLSVLAKQKGSERSFFLRQEGPTSLDCLAFGYLALMTAPDVPRPFLRDALRRHHHDLAVFVADMRETCFGARMGGDGSSASEKSPALALASATITSRAPRYFNPLWLRTLHGVVHSVPGLSGEWLVWLWRRIRVEGADDDVYDDVYDDGRGEPSTALWRRDAAAARRQRLVAVSCTLAGTVLAVGLIFGYRRLPAFGSPIVVYRRVPSSLAGLGAVGAMLRML